MTLEELTTRLATDVVSQFAFIDVLNSGERPVFLFKIFPAEGPPALWSIDLRSKIPRFRFGAMPDYKPDLTIEIGERVLMDLAEDRISPLIVLRSGAVRVLGDPGPLLLLARRLV